jgi:NAD(P)-dependent dehydrogenase (short-subunit alcohol dehydrogenase family)
VVSVVVTWVWAGSPFVVPSAMSKAGIHVMTQSLAVEWGRYGIRLNAIAPGLFPTEGAGKRLYPGQEGKDREAAQANPMRRFGRMPELQNLASFLMADGCEWLSGQTIALDGAGWQANGGGFTQMLGWGDAEWEQARALIKAQNEKDKAQRSV